MNPLIIANIEQVEASKLLVIVLYGKDGYLVDQIIVPFEDYPEAIKRIKALTVAYKLSCIDVWTSNPDLYRHTLHTPGIAGVMKHSSDTSDTRQALRNIASILPDIYEIKPISRPPKWKEFLINGIRKILKGLEGERNYEI